MNYNIECLIKAKVNIEIEASSKEEALKKLYKKDINKIVDNGVIEETDIDEINIVEG